MAPIKTTLLKSIRSPLLKAALEIVAICEDGDRIILIVPENKPEVLRWLTCPSRKAELKEACAKGGIQSLEVRIQNFRLILNSAF